MAEKKEKPREIRKARLQRLALRYRAPLILTPSFVVITFSLFFAYGSVNPLAWLYALVFAAIIVLSFIYTGAR